MASMQTNLRRLLVVVLFLTSAPLYGQTKPQDFRCGRIAERQAYGPYDYRTHIKERNLVGRFHFGARKQRQALAGNTRAWGGIDYTLRAIPNWPQALFLLGVLEHRAKRNAPESYQGLTLKDSYAPVECYFQRARQFAPDDENVVTAYARVLHYRGQKKEALEAFRTVVKMAPNSPKAHHNLAAALFSVGQFPESAQAARRAYELGYRKQDLKQKLAQKGYWK